MARGADLGKFEVHLKKLSVAGTLWTRQGMVGVSVKKEPGLREGLVRLG